jgi:hypothetical protein
MVTYNGLPGLFFVLTSILLDLALVFLDTVTIVLWDMTRAVLVAMISGSVGAVFSVLVTHRSSDLSLVLPGGDGGADVVDLSIFLN